MLDIRAVSLDNIASCFLVLLTAPGDYCCSWMRKGSMQQWVMMYRR